MKVRVVNLRDEPCDIRICRPGPFGNPFKITPKRTREQAVEAHRTWMDSPSGRKAVRGLIFEAADWIVSNPSAVELRLGCWCYPLPCHGDALAEAIRGAKVIACRMEHEPEDRRAAGRAGT